MENEKRMAGDYAIVRSMRIGESEIVLGQKITPDGAEYLVANRESNGIFAAYTECLVSEDYAEMIKEYGKRVSESAEAVIAEHTFMKENGVPMEPFSDFDRISHDDNIEGKIVVINPDSLRSEYRSQGYQLLLCEGGFGSKPNSRGTACYCTDLFRGRHSRFERYDIIGTVPEDRLPEWAKQGLSRIKQAKAKKHEAR